ncbi:MAG: DUF5060 domain-containing protein, partial [Caldilineaceae bacterium]|nr:DUF5060 domain-containing protein [Caldilineaceae bacterium]
MHRKQNQKVRIAVKFAPFIIIGFIFALFQIHAVKAQSGSAWNHLAGFGVQSQEEALSASILARNEQKSMPNRSAKQWEMIEWSVENSTYTGNPYDLVAVVSFKHQDSNAEHKIEMFYAGGSVWKFRFTGTQPGQWTF